MKRRSIHSLLIASIIAVAVVLACVVSAYARSDDDVSMPVDNTAIMQTSYQNQPLVDTGGGVEVAVHHSGGFPLEIGVECGTEKTQKQCPLTFSENPQNTITWSLQPTDTHKPNILTIAHASKPQDTPFGAVCYDLNYSTLCNADGREPFGILHTTNEYSNVVRYRWFADKHGAPSASITIDANLGNITATTLRTTVLIAINQTAYHQWTVSHPNTPYEAEYTVMSDGKPSKQRLRIRIDDNLSPTAFMPANMTNADGDTSGTHHASSESTQSADPQGLSLILTREGEYKAISPNTDPTPITHDLSEQAPSPNVDGIDTINPNVKGVQNATPSAYPADLMFQMSFSCNPDTGDCNSKGDTFDVSLQTPSDVHWLTFAPKIQSWNGSLCNFQDVACTDAQNKTIMLYSKPYATVTARNNKLMQVVLEGYSPRFSVKNTYIKFPLAVQYEAFNEWLQSHSTEKNIPITLQVGSKAYHFNLSMPTFPSKRIYFANSQENNTEIHLHTYQNNVDKPGLEQENMSDWQRASYAYPLDVSNSVNSHLALSLIYKPDSQYGPISPNQSINVSLRPVDSHFDWIRVEDIMSVGDAGSKQLTGPVIAHDLEHPESGKTYQVGTATVNSDLNSATFYFEHMNKNVTWKVLKFEPIVGWRDDAAKKFFRKHMNVTSVPIAYNLTVNNRVVGRVNFLVNNTLVTSRDETIYDGKDKPSLEKDFGYNDEETAVTLHDWGLDLLTLPKHNNNHVVIYDTPGENLDFNGNLKICSKTDKFSINCGEGRLFRSTSQHPYSYWNITKMLEQDSRDGRCKQVYRRSDFYKYPSCLGFTDPHNRSADNSDMEVYVYDIYYINDTSITHDMFISKPDSTLTKSSTINYTVASYDEGNVTLPSGGVTHHAMLQPHLLFEPLPLGTPLSSQQQRIIDDAKAQGKSVSKGFKIVINNARNILQKAGAPNIGVPLYIDYDTDITGPRPQELNKHKYAFYNRAHTLTEDANHPDGEPESLDAVTYEAQIGKEAAGVAAEAKPYRLVNIKKVDSDTNIPLQGAHFKVCYVNEHNNTLMNINNPTVPATPETCTTAKNMYQIAMHDLVTDKQGDAHIVGNFDYPEKSMSTLPFGHYAIIETQAPVGYSKDSSYHFITVTDDTAQTGYDITVKDKPLQPTISYKGGNLPLTGSNVLLFMETVGMLVSIAGCMIYRRCLL